MGPQHPGGTFEAVTVEGCRGIDLASGDCRSRLLTVTTSLRQQSREFWQFLDQALIAYHRGGEMPSLLQNP